VRIVAAPVVLKEGAILRSPGHPPPPPPRTRPCPDRDAPRPARSGTPPCRLIVFDLP